MVNSAGPADPSRAARRRRRGEPAEHVIDELLQRLDAGARHEPARHAVTYEPARAEAAVSGVSHGSPQPIISAGGSIESTSRRARRVAVVDRRERGGQLGAGVEQVHATPPVSLREKGGRGG